jgi:hypothetical protein
MSFGKSQPSAPKAPDPVKTAQAQTASNLATAQAQAAINNINTVGPTGTTTYTQNYVPKYDANGNQISGSGPQWTQTVKLSPEQQILYDLTTQGQTTYGNTANTLLTNAQGMLSKPISTDYDKYRTEAETAAFSRLDPKFAQAEEGMRSRLLNAGIAPGAEAWANEYRDFNQGKNDAWLQAVAQGGNTAGQALQQEAALRAVPLNEANALLTGSQVNAPQLQQTNPTQVAPTDVIGATNGAYANQVNAYNAQMANQSSALGGMFGLAGTLGAAALRFSDRRLKRDIVPLGALTNGIPVYEFRYIWDDADERHIGVMAQDVVKVLPDAVRTNPAGFMMVNYEMVVRYGK